MDESPKWETKTIKMLEENMEEKPFDVVLVSDF